jgi:UDPglucose 6-dehydrogenase
LTIYNSTGAIMRVAVVGTGYVGLVSGASFARLGHSVVCIDTNKSKIDQLKRGRIPIFEPGLQELVQQGAAARRLTFTSDVKAGLKRAQVVFICVGTPLAQHGGLADLSFVYEAAAIIAAHLRGFTVVATKSTVPVGTGEEIEAIIRKTAPEDSFAVVSNPEFLREGSAIDDFLRPDRIVIGTNDEEACAVMQRLYAPLCSNGAPLVVTARRTAEMIKYAANAFLATKIAFVGELADLCERSGADIEEVTHGIGFDKRIGSNFLRTGPGYGGSCFPKDTLSLLATAQQHNARMRILETVVAVNQARKHAMVGKIVEACGGAVEGKRIAVLGLTFKADTDDMREAASLTILPALEALGARIRSYDPAGMEQARKLLSGLEMSEGVYECADSADALLILTEWNQFRNLDFGLLKQLLRGKTIIDLRNLYQPAAVATHGFTYVSLGRAVAGTILSAAPQAPRGKRRRRGDGIGVAATQAS